MPNYCYYEMKVKGRKEDCYKWLSKMRSYDEENHFYRIFDADITDECGTDNDYSIIISGDCAWSLETCCRSSGYSGGIDLFAENSKVLNIIMEAYSQEPGCCFQEHYIYNRGRCCSDECEDWSEYYWDRDECSFEDYKKDYDVPDSITESDFDDEGYYHEGGFGEWNFVI